ncbi:MAG: BON domain-containing protein [Acidobacteria bacterium]|nr:BON domain-containing protein [Acidobacteriota bacterium]
MGPRWLLGSVLLAFTTAGFQPAAAPTDAQLEQAIQERFARSKISRNNFQVRVQGGVATLTGKTDVLQHKGVATRLARTAGARQVVNRIEVSEAARKKASDNLAQGRRRAQVKRGEPPQPRSESRKP